MRSFEDFDDKLLLAEANMFSNSLCAMISVLWEERERESARGSELSTCVLQ